jgi:hypothetical protein
MISDKSKYITKFTPESDLPGKFFMFSRAIASGLKGVLINFVMYFDLLFIIKYL